MHTNASICFVWGSHLYQKQRQSPTCSTQTKLKTQFHIPRRLVSINWRSHATFNVSRTTSSGLQHRDATNLWLSSIETFFHYSSVLQYPLRHHSGALSRYEIIEFCRLQACAVSESSISHGSCTLNLKFCLYTYCLLYYYLRSTVLVPCRRHIRYPTATSWSLTPYHYVPFSC